MSAPVDHPPPLCPSCTARMKQAVAEGMVGIIVCGDCQTREAARLKAEGHPPPWRWQAEYGERVLVDAAGEMVGPVVSNDPWPPGMLAQVAAPPEMETMLRETLRLFGEPHPGEMEFVPCEKCVHVSEVRALLNRLDEARKGHRG